MNPIMAELEAILAPESAEPSRRLLHEQRNARLLVERHHEQFKRVQARRGAGAKTFAVSLGDGSRDFAIDAYIVHEYVARKLDEAMDRYKRLTKTVNEMNDLAHEVFKDKDKETEQS